jgi:hypothetical protein
VYAENAVAAVEGCARRTGLLERAGERARTAANGDPLANASKPVRFAAVGLGDVGGLSGAVKGLAGAAKGLAGVAEAPAEGAGEGLLAAATALAHGEGLLLRPNSAGPLMAAKGEEVEAYARKPLLPYMEQGS